MKQRGREFPSTLFKVFSKQYMVVNHQLAQPSSGWASSPTRADPSPPDHQTRLLQRTTRPPAPTVEQLSRYDSCVSPSWGKCGCETVPTPSFASGFVCLAGRTQHRILERSHGVPPQPHAHLERSQVTLGNFGRVQQTVFTDSRSTLSSAHPPLAHPYGEAPALRLLNNCTESRASSILFQVFIWLPPFNRSGDLHPFRCP
jgi:hypothetical protein